jgi:hypothetical protein
MTAGKNPLRSGAVATGACGVPKEFRVPVTPYLFAAFSDLAFAPKNIGGRLFNLFHKIKTGGRHPVFS